MSKFLVKASAVLTGTVIAATGVLVAPAATAATVSVPAVSAASAPSVVPAYTKKQERFVRYIRNEAPSLRALTKADAVDLGKTTCRALRSGVDTYDVIYAYTDSGFSDDETVAMISGAVIYLCPDQSYLFE